MDFGRDCRSCGAELEDVFLDLGASPLANSYVSLDSIYGSEAYLPLLVLVCNRCWLVQLQSSIKREDVFTEYAYQSSWSTSWVEHARSYAASASERLGLGASSQVVELASNDGYMLQWFIERGVPALGVEPAANIAKLAQERGIPTRIEFFGVSTGKQLNDELGGADLIIANNVLAHVDDIHDFVGGIAALLAPTGRASIEFPHLMRLIDEIQFDTIYHEHVSYLSIVALEPLLAKHGLAVVDIEEISVHGGSLRMWIAHKGATPELPSVGVIRRAEAQAGLGDPETYAKFGPTVAALKRRILTHLITLLDEGKRIAAYGAPAKGNTMLNYCGIGAEMVEFTVDRNPDKQGTLLPGSRIPVLDPSALDERKPDVVVLLPWNLKSELVSQLSSSSAGSELHVLCPEPARIA